MVKEKGGQNDKTYSDKGNKEEMPGMLLELERKVDNVTLGIDVTYNLDCGEDETPLMISDEYVKEQV